MSQVQPKKIDWTACETAEESLKEVVKDFNKGRTDGLVLEVDCTYRGDPSYKEKPEERVALSPGEIVQLNALRRTSFDAYETESAYEKYLMDVHQVRHPTYDEDPCLGFVGIKYDDDFITVDPNPTMADCRH